jgi:hypothetical protein
LWGWEDSINLVIVISFEWLLEERRMKFFGFAIHHMIVNRRDYRKAMEEGLNQKWSGVAVPNLMVYLR